MQRRNILPQYIDQEAWVTLCDAIDAVFKDTVDLPIEALGKLRQPWTLADTAQDKIISLLLLDPATDLDVFERDILVKQINLLGYAIRNPDALSTDQLARFFRYIAKFWYSKGTYQIADFLAYVLATSVILTNLWTRDYVDFLPEGDPGIGARLDEGGSWYPTTHVQVELELLELPPGMTPERFGEIFEDLCNYPLVLYSLISNVTLWFTSTTGHVVPVAIAHKQINWDFFGNFDLSASDKQSEDGAVGFTPINVIPVVNDAGYVPPALPTVDFSGDVVSGAAPLNVTFTPAITGSWLSLAWDFTSNGSLDSFSEIPSYVYSSAGTYSVTLRVTNEGGTQTKVKTAYITAT